MHSSKFLAQRVTPEMSHKRRSSLQLIGNIPKSAKLCGQFYSPGRREVLISYQSDTDLADTRFYGNDTGNRTQNAAGLLGNNSVNRSQTAAGIGTQNTSGMFGKDEGNGTQNHAGLFRKDSVNVANRDWQVIGNNPNRIPNKNASLLSEYNPKNASSKGAGLYEDNSADGYCKDSSTYRNYPNDGFKKSVRMYENNRGDWFKEDTYLRDSSGDERINVLLLRNNHGKCVTRDSTLYEDNSEDRPIKHAGLMDQPRKWSFPEVGKDRLLPPSMDRRSSCEPSLIANFVSPSSVVR